jgi:hypothetical protein
MKNLEIRTDQDNAILGQNFSIFEKLEKFVSIFHTGPKFFKRVLKKKKKKKKISKENSSTLGWLSQSDAKETEEEIQDSASTIIALHWGKIFLSSRS